MPQFRSDVLDDLTRQFTFNPPERRRAIIDNAEQLYWDIDPALTYPLDFLIFKLTSYRPDTTEDVNFIGQALKQDLITLVESLSQSLDESFNDYTPKPYTLQELATHLNVSTKTIRRYRNQGLFSRKLQHNSHRKKLAFLTDSVQRFQALAQSQLNSASNFSRIDEPTTHQIITRARRIVARNPSIPPMHVAVHLAKKYNRSTETLRALLRRHDIHDPRLAIFKHRTDPLTTHEQLNIYNAYKQGQSVRTLANQYHRSRSIIYRAINLSRVQALKNLNLHFQTNPTFTHPEANDIILNTTTHTTSADSSTPSNITDTITPLDTPDTPTPISDLYKIPPPEQAAEQAQFLLYNFLKYRINQIISTLSIYHPASGQIDHAETFLRRATQAKNQLVNNYLRLVISVARQHITGSSRPNINLSELIADGNLVLLQTIETFDVARGNRFSTYLSYALMRRFAYAYGAGAGGNTKADPDDHALSYDTLANDQSPQLPQHLNPPQAAIEHTQQVNTQIQRLFATLDDRERIIITRHFGLSIITDLNQTNNPTNPDTQIIPQTLAQIAKQLNITPERARQIEQRGLIKLKQTANDLGISFDDLSLLDTDSF